MSTNLKLATFLAKMIALRPIPLFCGPKELLCNIVSFFLLGSYRLFDPLWATDSHSLLLRPLIWVIAVGTESIARAIWPRWSTINDYHSGYRSYLVRRLQPDVQIGGIESLSGYYNFYTTRWWWLLFLDGWLLCIIQ